MWALEAAFPGVRRDLPVVPRAPAWILGGAVAGGVALTATGHLAVADFRAVIGAVLHGALLTAALGAAAGAAGGRWTATTPAVVTIVMVALGTAASRFDSRGSLLYLVVALWLAGLGARGRLAPLGVHAVSGRAMLVGGLAGAALGGHVLLSAAFTLGYRLRSDGLGPWLLALAYDAGVNVPAAELFVRGVVFDRLQRQVSLATGAVVATILYLVRFLPDPRLPATVEVLAGATLYLTLLSLVNSWLFWWSGSLWPGLVSALVFFAAYRLLGT
jgi:hypothetical protein